MGWYRAAVFEVALPHSTRHKIAVRPAGASSVGPARSGFQRLVVVSVLGVPEVDAAVSCRWNSARSGFTH